jgi:hypothetical protein
VFHTVLTINCNCSPYTGDSQPVVCVPLGVHGRPVGWYAKIILVMAENTKKKKGVTIKAQKQSYEVLVYKDRLM